MITRSIPLLITALLLPVAACSLLQDNEDAQPVEEERISLPHVEGSAPADHDIIGAWQWIGSQGGIAGVTITPDSEGQSAGEIRFWSDERFSIFRADTLFVEGIYTIAPPEDETPFGYQVIHNQADNHQRMFGQLVQINARRDTLSLIDFCCDGFHSLYSRIE